MTDFAPSNKLRVDLYKRLYPEIINQDQISGALGPVIHWNDPDATWLPLGENASDLNLVWNAIGVSPLWQNLFFILETMEGEDLQVLENLDTVTDPLRCPTELLGDIAASFGYALEENISDTQKRVVLLGLIDAFKCRGERISWKVFYRLLGFDIVNVFPLFKKNIHEALGEYSRTRFVTSPQTNIPIGPGGQASFSGRIADVPIQPGTLLFKDTGVGGKVVRDDGEGGLVGAQGSVNYVSGAFTLTLPAPAIGPVVASLAQVTSEFPYQAARIDVEILLSPGGAPIPLVTPQSISNLLVRMEEVRPVHVLLRNLALIAEVDDTFGADGHSGATDQTGCVQILIDQRDGPPPPAIPAGRNFHFMIDEGPGAGDELSVQQVVSGSTTEYAQDFDELAELVCPIDALVIDQITGATHDKSYW